MIEMLSSPNSGKSSSKIVCANNVLPEAEAPAIAIIVGLVVCKFIKPYITTQQKILAKYVENNHSNHINNIAMLKLN